MRCLLFFVFLFLSACRVLPPLPGAPSDEKLFEYLEKREWKSEDLPVAFTSESAESLFSEDFMPFHLWRVQSRDVYNRMSPAHSAGVRRFFRFYVAETDSVSGLIVFIHEAVHAVNRIDLFDMAYNEFLCITAELHFVTLVVQDDPDLAVQIFNQALAIYLERDAHYEDESHMRARLWLSALLVEEEPLEIYRWARDASKSDFKRWVEKAIGSQPRDVINEGAGAFAKRHFPGNYVPLIVSLRRANDAVSRRQAYVNLLSQTDESDVFYDNIHWQLIKYSVELGDHEKALEYAEKIWVKTSESLLAPAIANSAFAAACVKDDAQLRELWQKRALQKPLWEQDALQWKMSRLRALHDNEHIDFIEFADELLYIKRNKKWHEYLDLHQPLEELETAYFLKEIERIKDKWQEEGVSLLEGSRLTQLEKFAEGASDKQLMKIVGSLKERLTAHLADQAFNTGNLTLAAGLYHNTSMGRHRLETKFWLDRFQ